MLGSLPRGFATPGQEAPHLGGIQVARPAIARRRHGRRPVVLGRRPDDGGGGHEGSPRQASSSGWLPRTDYSVFVVFLVCVSLFVFVLFPHFPLCFVLNDFMFNYYVYSVLCSFFMSFLFSLLLLCSFVCLEGKQIQN